MLLIAEMFLSFVDFLLYVRALTGETLSTKSNTPIIKKVVKKNNAEPAYSNDSTKYPWVMFVKSVGKNRMW